MLFIAFTHYQELVFHLLCQICYGILCPPFQYKPKKDVFNAAQSGAMITNVIRHEFSYLIKQIREVLYKIYIQSVFVRHFNT